MRMFGILFALLIAFGSVVPHAASAHQHSVAAAHTAPAAHDMSKSQHSAPKDCTDCANGCIGCAAPLRLALAPAAPVPTATTLRAHFQPAALTGFVATLELRPPRSQA